MQTYNYHCSKWFSRNWFSIHWLLFIKILIKEFAQCFLAPWDLSPRRSGNKYNKFFSHMKALIEESLVAADYCRHGVSYMSQWVSIRDLFKKTSVWCSENTPIPSKNLVRLQFIPQNPYTWTALNSTSRLQVQHNIQQRQLHATHFDDHYSTALLIYFKSKAVEEKIVLWHCVVMINLRFMSRNLMSPR